MWNVIDVYFELVEAVFQRNILRDYSRFLEPYLNRSRHPNSEFLAIIKSLSAVFAFSEHLWASSFPLRAQYKVHGLVLYARVWQRLRVSPNRYRGAFRVSEFTERSECVKAFPSRLQNFMFIIWVILVNIWNDLCSGKERLERSSVVGF